VNVERPILFKAPMVQAILAGRKTQTRRIINFNIRREARLPSTINFRDDCQRWRGAYDLHTGKGDALKLCPYGVVGDRLWVRETWADLTESHGQKWERYNEQTRLYDRGRTRFIWYRADGEQPMYDGEPAEKWRPSIFMLRADSRITLEITDVRAQRIQDISEPQAVVEGVHPAQGMRGGDDIVVQEIGNTMPFPASYPISRFVLLWDTINGKKKGCNWNSNPYVWAITFKRT
jgi:hypothetical protein